MKLVARAILAAMLVTLPGCARSSTGAKSAAKKDDKAQAAKPEQRDKATQSAKPKPADDSQRPIGTATMTKDETIILDLRAEHPDGTIGDARLVYPKTHAQYAEILKHLGGLKPGESKPVPPWPDKR